MATINGSTASETLNGTTSADSITGLNGNDTINAGDGNDTVIAGPASPVNVNRILDWTAQGGNGTNLAGGFTQNTGGVNATVTYTDTGAGTSFSVSTATQYRASGETFDTGSASALFGTGTGPTSTLGVSFAGVSGAGYQDEVSNVSFRLNDVDTGSWTDVITILAYDAAGNAVPVTITPAGNDTVSGNTITSGPGNDTASSANGSVLVTIPGPVKSFTVVYSNTGTGSQVVTLTDVHFQAQPSDNDLVDGGAGNDSIDGGFGDDTLAGGADNDTILGGLGNDSLAGDGGADSLLGGAGGDTLAGGTGGDTLDGGTGNDNVAGGNDADLVNVSVNEGVDTIAGGEGGTDNDTLAFNGVSSGPGVTVTFTGDEAGTYSFAGGGSGTFTQIEGLVGTGGDDAFDASAATVATTINAGAGADTIIGGAGDDTLTGGAGSDSMTGGAGADSLSGGDDQDVFTITAGEGDGDVVAGGEGGTDFDVLNLVGKYTIAYDVNDPESGTITWRNGDVTTFTGIEQINFVPCFTPGSLVETRRGLVPVETIREGDMVLTRDSGYRPVRWVGRRNLTAAELAANPALRPVRIAIGALGAGCPSRDMTVSPQHRMLVEGAAVELATGEAEALVAAIHLVGTPGVSRVDATSVSYIHILFDAHEVIRVDGSWTESFQPGSRTLGDMDHATRTELLTLFPELATQDGLRAFAAARVSLKRHEVLALSSYRIAA